MVDNSYETEVDFREDIIPPWENNFLLQHDKILKDVVGKFELGKNHHAILMKGKKGIGKATLSYHIARRIFQLSDTAPNVPLFSHPNLYVLKRKLADDKKKFRTNIAIKQVQELTEKLHQSPSVRGWRVVIVDPIDDMRHEAANAFLKTLEEPPEKVQFLLVCHKPSQILPTIKSRCLTKPVYELDENQTQNVISHTTGSEDLDTDLQNAIHFFPNQPGSALEVYKGDMSKMYSLAYGISSQALRGMQVDTSNIQALASEMQKKGRDVSIPIIMHFLWSKAVEAARLSACDGDLSEGQKLSDVSLQISKIQSESEIYNLDLTGMILKVVGVMRSATTA